MSSKSSKQKMVPFIECLNKSIKITVKSINIQLKVLHEHETVLR